MNHGTIGRFASAAVLAGVLAAVSLTATNAQAPQAKAQAKAKGPAAWFGVPTPGPVSDLDIPTFVQDPHITGPQPALFPKIKDPTGALTGARMMVTVKTITNFSRESRAAGDILWGRVSGRPAEKKTVDWLMDQLKSYGIKDAHTEEYISERPLWWPTAVEVKVLGDASYGAGTGDVRLQSALPTSSAKSVAAPIVAPLVFVGRGSPAELANIDVKGKIAVVNVVPDLSLFAAREKGVARDLAGRGAVGVINAVESPGNLQFSDGRYGCGDGPCFMVGGDDGAFLESVIGKAAAQGKTLRASLSVKSETLTATKAYNGVATIAGKSPEVIIVNAHADAWFDGANDNADGLAVFLGLAEHYAKSGIKPDRTLVFMASGGHHTANGAAAFIAAHKDIIDRTVMVINLEHLAQIQVDQGPRLDPAGSPYSAGLWSAGTSENLKRAGAANTTPFVAGLMDRASRVYGVATTYGVSESVPGDLGSYTRTGKPAVQLISSEVYYHSSGDNPSTISPPGMERAAYFWRDFINNVGKAPKAQLLRAGPARPAAPSGEG